MERDLLLWGLWASALACGPFWAYDRFIFSKKRVVIGSTPWGVERLAPWFVPLAALALAKIFLIEPFQVPSASMRPTLSPGSVVLSTKWDYWRSAPSALNPLGRFFQPQRGEVILFRYPLDPSSFFVKRVIGEPGDIVSVALNGAVSVNGSPLARELVSSCAKSSEPSERVGCSTAWRESWGGKSWTVWEGGEPLQARLARASRCSKSADGALSCAVPSDCYFVMGDNRQDSFDSRDWGCVPRSALEGRARVEFSFSRWGSSGWIR